MSTTASAIVFDTPINNYVVYYYVTVISVCVNFMLVGGAMTKIEDEPGMSISPF